VTRSRLIKAAISKPGGLTATRLLISANWLNFVKAREKAYISKYLAERHVSPGIALDIGCGCGEWCNRLEGFGYAVHGIDPASEELTAAKDLTAALGHRSEFTLSAAEKLPFKDRTFDLIISVCAIEHFQDFRKALSEMGRVLKPGGSLILTADSFSYQDVGVKLGRKHREMYHVVNYFTIEQLTQELNKAGFKVNRAEYFINSPLSARFFRGLIRFPVASLPLYPVALPLSAASDRLFGKGDAGQIIALSATRSPD
jgi:ubiquinone/menaquinone biosynthesis C-methylase UbiE